MSNHGKNTSGLHKNYLINVLETENLILSKSYELNDLFFYSFLQIKALNMVKLKCLINK